MPKANRTCYCCGQKYYYCPSCTGERKDPRIYTMWDSETCRDIFNTLVSESTKKITTLECKKKLIELGVDKNTMLKDSIRKHVDRVMSCEEEIIEEIQEVKDDIVIENIEEQIEEITNMEKQLYVDSLPLTEEVKLKVEEFKIQIEEATDNLEASEEIKAEDVKNVKKKTRKNNVKNKENSEVD